MAEKVSNPRGFRDFLPPAVARRQYLLGVLTRTFRRFGFVPVETPAMEHLSTLTGKYGEEGDQLLYRVLNSGDFLKDLSPEERTTLSADQLAPRICDRALRYDLTVPFARLVVQHRNAITFPFKRYQIQPVWRADRPQRGRYREFTQCDVDVVGSSSLLYEAECLEIFATVLQTFRLPQAHLNLNHRQLLHALAPELDAAAFIQFCTALDKLDKIGTDKVVEEFAQRGLPAQSLKPRLEQLQQLLDQELTWEAWLETLPSLLPESTARTQALADLQSLGNYLAGFDWGAVQLRLDPTLARGLNYYTGCIMEVRVPGAPVGSVGGGGRYDDLTGLFGLPDVSGVGVSFGLDRLVDVLDHFELWPAQTRVGAQVLVVNFGGADLEPALRLVRSLRQAGLEVELYPEAAKLGKQFGYADKKEIPFTVVWGEQERLADKLNVKNMRTGQQAAYSLAEAVAYMQAEA